MVGGSTPDVDDIFNLAELPPPCGDNDMLAASWTGGGGVSAVARRRFYGDSNGRNENEAKGNERDDGNEGNERDEGKRKRRKKRESYLIGKTLCAKSIGIFLSRNAT